MKDRNTIILSIFCTDTTCLSIYTVCLQAITYSMCELCFQGFVIGQLFEHIGHVARMSISGYRC